MPAFRLVVDRDYSAPFRHLADPETIDVFHRFRFTGSTLDESLRPLVQKLNMAGRTCALVEEREWKAAFFDMDSTVIAEESIVELARASGKAREVAAITERAMAGELDFATALRARVQMLAGVPDSIFETVSPTLTINPGMAAFAAAARAQGIQLFLISGGFKPLAAVIARALGFDGYDANELAVKGHALTGELQGPLVDGTAKARFLEVTCATLGIARSAAIAVGDGANDLPMLKLAGAAFGYHPKPVLIPHIHGANFHDHRLLIHTLL